MEASYGCSMAVSGTLKTWSVIDVAKTILEGVNKRSFTIAPGFGNKLLSLLHSLLGPFLMFIWITSLNGRGIIKNSLPLTF